MKVKLYKLTIGEKFYYGTTTQELRQRFNEHKSWNRWKFDDWSVSSIELIEEFECETKRERDKKEDDILKEHIGNPLCLNVRRAFITIEEQKQKNSIVNKLWNENNVKKVIAYRQKRNTTMWKCEKCNGELLLPNVSRHKARCGLMKVSKSTNEKNIYKTEYNKFQVQILKAGNRTCKSFDTIEEAITFRNSNS